MKEELITMSKKEIKRVEVIMQIQNKQCTQKGGAERLGMTPRHMRRLCQRHRRWGLA